MSSNIEHSGIITHIDGNNIQVRIIQMSACSSCHAKGACSASDMDEKIIDVESRDTSFKTGEMVTLIGSSSNGMLAVLLAFVIPFLLILLALIILPNYTSNEAISGTIALSLLIPYYIILSFYNKKLKSKFKFHIRKLQENEQK